MGFKSCHNRMLIFWIGFEGEPTHIFTSCNSKPCHTYLNLNGRYHVVPTPHYSLIFGFWRWSFYGPVNISQIMIGNPFRLRTWNSAIHTLSSYVSFVTKTESSFKKSKYAMVSNKVSFFFIKPSGGPGKASFFKC